jgi:molybdopterin converting factor subunit 1
MIAVQAKLFAIVRDITGKGEERIQLPDDATVADVLNALTSRYPRLEEWKSFLRFAVNQSYALQDEPLHNNDEVAVIPPVSGG